MKVQRRASVGGSSLAETHVRPVAYESGAANELSSRGWAGRPVDVAATVAKCSGVVEGGHVGGYCAICGLCILVMPLVCHSFDACFHPDSACIGVSTAVIYASMSDLGDTVRYFCCRC